MLKLREAEDGSACFILENLDDTAELGRKIAASLQPGMTLLMEGTLGAGKTTLLNILEDGWVLIVEWPEHLAECSFEEVWHCLMEAGNEKRTFSVRAEGQTAEAALTVLENLCR